MISFIKRGHEKRLRKAFAELINTIMFDDECYPEPELLEGGTRLVHFTVLIRLKGLERVYLKYPKRLKPTLKAITLPEAGTVFFLPQTWVAVRAKITDFSALIFFG